MQAGPVMETLAERVSDTEKEVRTGLMALLGEVVLPGLGPAALAPFLPLLMAHVSSAMTHLADGVRQGFCPCMLAAPLYPSPAVEQLLTLSNYTMNAHQPKCTPVDATGSNRVECADEYAGMIHTRYEISLSGTTREASGVPKISAEKPGVAA